MAQGLIRLRYVTFDVFTNKRYTGNPLGIVEVPKSVGLSQAQKQAIALEFNLSECTFLHERIDYEEPLVWKVDIFSTAAEIPFAGHPTIGTACYALSQVAQSRGMRTGSILGQFSFKAGTIYLDYDVGRNRARAGIPHDVHIHNKLWTRVELLELQPQLAKASQRYNFRLREHYPIVSIVKGMTFVLVELENLQALETVTTSTCSVSASGLDEGWDKTFIGTYFFVRTADRDDRTKTIRARMIQGALEDPASGSAASDLAAFLSLSEGKPGQTMRFEVTQGVELGRQSNIGIEVVLAEGSGIDKLYLEGGAIQVMEGNLVA